MRSALKLLRIEFRRNLGLLLFPLLVAAAWWMSRVSTGEEGYVWLDTSVAVWESVLFTGPLIGGVAAWMAGRNRRRGMGDVLATTPRPPAARDLTTWAGTALWGLVAYMLLATALLALTWRNATWDGPLWGYMFAGLVAVIACSAIGYAADHWLQHRLTAPLVVMVLFLALGMPATTADRDPNLELLSPVPLALLNSASVFYEVPRVTPQQLLWPLGLAGVALAAVAVKGGRQRVIPLAALLGSVAVATAGLFASVGDARPTGTPLGEPVPFEHVCRDDAVTVCVHPAYEGLLPETAKAINWVTEPLVGLPGVPTRAMQVDPFGPSGTVSGKNGLSFHINSMRRGDPDWLKYEVLTSLLWSGSEVAMAEAEPTAEDLERCGEVWEPDPEDFPNAVPGAVRLHPDDVAMSVVEEWLVEHSGARNPEVSGPAPENQCSNFDALVERFSDLDPSERRAWLEENFAGLRAGEVTLKNLP